MLENQARRGSLLVVAAAILWGTTGTAQALAPEGAQPILIGTLRLVIGGAALLIIALARGIRFHLRTWPLKPTLLTGLTIATYQLCFFGGVARTGVAVGTIVGIGSAPIMAGFLAWWLNREKPGPRWLAATLLAIVGCGLLVAPGQDARVDAVGVILALGAGLSYALYTLFSKRLLAHYPPDAVMAVVFCLGALLLAPTLLLTDLDWLAEPRSLVVILHLGLVATALAYVLFARGLSRVLTATAVTLSLAEPLTAGILGVWVVGERLSALAIVGIGLLVAGLGLLTFPFPNILKPRFVP
ncbi:MAG: DMT family transporter [Anaerolineae bacterium]|nr:DMT family transporter [Anaerolineae bacterium]